MHGAPWSIRTAQPVVDPGEQAAADAENPAKRTSLPTNFGVNLANFNMLNWLRTKRYANKKALATTVAENLQRQRMPELSDAEFQRLLRTVKPIETIVLNNIGDVDVFYKSLSEINDMIDANSINNEAAITKLYMPADNAGTASPQAASWQTVSAAFQTMMNEAEAKARAVAPTMTPAAPIVGKSEKNIVTAQLEVPPPESALPPDPANPAVATPLSSEKYTSVRSLTEDLIAMGPNPDTYNKFMSLVAEEDQDSVKEALSKFFQGSPTSICFLYEALIDVGMASAIDHEIVERIMEQHPNLDKETKQASYEGLFLPPLDASLHTMEKKAGRMSESYIMYGGKDNRMCPKTRNMVSTYICRFHCLDGLAVDDAQVVCGEAIWRGNVMDKFSREYKDEDGSWTGGYLRKRFQVDQNDGGHPYQLKPGQRQRPIHEDAWSPEKRLQELRRDESKSREYCETPGDPKGLYNFDPYEVKPGPKDPNLYIKPKDKISKLAGKNDPKVITGKQCLICGAGLDKMATQCKCGSFKLKTVYKTDNVGINQIDHPKDMPATIPFGRTAALEDPREHMVPPTPVWYVDIQNGKPAVLSYQPGAVGEVDPILKPEGTGLPMGPFNSDEEAEAALQRMLTQGIAPRAFNLATVKTAKKSELDKKFDRCVEHVKDKGMPDDSAYPICMVSTGKGKKHKKKKKSKKAFNRAEVKTAEPKPVVTCLAGIYRAEKDGQISFGDTEKQALRRLADVKGLEDLQPGTVDQVDQELSDFRQQVLPQGPSVAPVTRPPAQQVPPMPQKQEPAPAVQNVPAEAPAAPKQALPVKRFDDSMVKPYIPENEAPEEETEEETPEVNVQDLGGKLEPEHPVDAKIIGSQVMAETGQQAEDYFTADEAMEQMPSYGLSDDKPAK